MPPFSGPAVHKLHASWDWSPVRYDMGRSVTAASLAVLWQSAVPFNPRGRAHTGYFHWPAFLDPCSSSSRPPYPQHLRHPAPCTPRLHHTPAPSPLLAPPSPADVRFDRGRTARHVQQHAVPRGIRPLSAPGHSTAGGDSHAPERRVQTAACDHANCHHQQRPTRCDVLGRYGAIPGRGTKWPCNGLIFPGSKNEMPPLANELHFLAG